jgi:hypothetical protein
MLAGQHKLLRPIRNMENSIYLKNAFRDELMK